MFRLFYLERLQQTQSPDSPEAQQQSFNEFVNLVVTAQQAPALKLTDRHDVQLGLELQKLKLYSSVALQAMAMDIQPTEEELKKAYDEAVKEVKQDQYKARHILVKEEAEAKKLIAELDKKADFTELAKKHSIGPAGKNGGDLDWFTAGQMVKPFSDAAAALEKGSYTKTPVQTQFGWHVILLEDKRVAEPPSFEDAKPQLIAAIQRNKLGEQIIELRKTTKLELNEDVIKLKEDPAKAEAEKTAPAKADAAPRSNPMPPGPATGPGAPTSPDQIQTNFGPSTGAPARPRCLAELANSSKYIRICLCYKILEQCRAHLSVDALRRRPFRRPPGPGHPDGGPGPRPGVRGWGCSPRPAGRPRRHCRHPDGLHPGPAARTDQPPGGMPALSPCRSLQAIPGPTGSTIAQRPGAASVIRVPGFRERQGGPRPPPP